MSEPGDIANKRLTLSSFNLNKAKCSDRLKSNQLNHLSSVKRTAEIEIRKKKKLLDPSLLGVGADGFFTEQEQISRINALHNAALAKQEMKDLSQEKVEDHVEDHNEQENEQVIDYNNQIPGEVEYPNNSSKNIENINSDDQKFKRAKVNINKDHFSEIYSKHSKFALEKALTHDESDLPKQIFGIRAKKNRYSKVAKRSNISREILIPDQITVKELAMRMAEKSKDVLNILLKIGKSVKVDDFLDPDTACEVAMSFNHTFKKVDDSQIEAKIFQIDGEDDLSKLSRPPVVTFMGHVDHGKTSLLDFFRQSSIAEKEFGGITQGIGAYQTKTQSGHKITFIDTPGHEAFTAMRTCGANATDIVVLVVAADDGIMEQTIEAINHAKAANVPIIVAVNKIDKVNNVENSVQKIISSFSQYGLIPEELGGDVIVVPVSAKQKMNLDKLEEAILLISELMDFKSITNCRASGAVIESKVDRSCGILATLIVQQGTLKVGDIIVAGNQYGKIRSMFNNNKENEKTALPSTPVEVTGFKEIPNSGDKFVVVKSEAQAQEIVEYRKNLEQNEPSTNSFDIFSQEDDVKEIPAILKCDVKGSIEAIYDTISKLNNEEVKLNILHKAVGGITDSDILLAEASKAIILAFNVRVDSKIKNLAKEKKIDIYVYHIIYELINDVKDRLNKMLKPIIREHHVGFASVKEVFGVEKKAASVLGCYVTDGMIKKGALVKLMRSSKLIYEGKVKTLRRFKDDVKEVKSGFECGISLDGCSDVQPNDVIETFDLITEERKLS